MRQIEDRDGELEVAGVRITSPDRVLWEGQGVTKRELVEYYVAVEDLVLPGLVGRPLTLVRCPAAAGQRCFVQKHARDSIPGTVPRVPIPGDPGPDDYMYVDGPTSLLALVQLGVLEFHVWGSRHDRLDRPDRLVFDLDPDEATPFGAVAGAALWIRRRLGAVGLASWPKSTGGRGLHVVVPLARRTGWEEVKTFAHRVARELVVAEPRRHTTRLVKGQRDGKILVDYYRNAWNATAIAEYSPRARPGAPVAVPLHWDEVDPGAARAPRFTVREAPARIAELGNPWEGFAAVRQSLTAAMLG